MKDFSSQGKSIMVHANLQYFPILLPYFCDYCYYKE